jgi:hypothetical protein
MAGSPSIGRPFVVSPRPPDLLLCAKDLFVAAKACWQALEPRTEETYRREWRVVSASRCVTSANVKIPLR